MKVCLRRFCCFFFCCQCCSKSSLQLIDNHTRLLPRIPQTKPILEENELHSFGYLPLQVQGTISLSHINSQIQKIVTGKNHCLILFQNNTLFGFGSNEEGQLGLPISTQTSCVNTLQRISFTIPNKNGFIIRDIAAGDAFSYVLIEHNGLTSLVKFGVNQRDRYRFTLNDVNVISLEELPNFKGEVERVYANEQRVIIICNVRNLGGIYLRKNIYYKGIGFERNKEDSFVLLHSFEYRNYILKQVCLGVNHLIILTYNLNEKKQIVYGISDNTYSELGDKANNLELDKLTEITFGNIDNDSIKKIACGARHTLILCGNKESNQENILYCLGDNSQGQCCGFSSQVNKPQRIEINNKSEIVDVYCGATHNLIKLANGNLLTWGDAEGGKLGYVEEHLTQFKPQEILMLKQKNIIYVSMGYQMTVIASGQSPEQYNDIKIKNTNEIVSDSMRGTGTGSVVLQEMELKGGQNDGGKPEGQTGMMENNLLPFPQMMFQKNLLNQFPKSTNNNKSNV